MANLVQKKRTLQQSFKKNFQDILFCFIILLYPTVQFIIFYLGVNVNTILLSFEKYDETKYIFAGFENFSVAFYNLFEVKEWGMAIGNSLVYLGVATVVGMTLSLLFSYYIYLKKPMAGFFKVMLFMPAVVSSIVLTTIYRSIVGDVYSEIVFKLTGEVVPGLMKGSHEAQKFVTFFYNVTFGFGTTVLLYSGAMSGTNESVMEYTDIDGANYTQKFFYVLLPMIFPTFITFMVMRFADTFMNQMNLLGICGDSAPYQVETIGYKLYTKTLKVNGNPAELPLLATYGLIFTMITIPVVFTVKHLLEKFGPNER